MSASANAPGTARQWPLIIACALASFLVYTDFFAVQVALPDMATDLNSNVADLQWVISGYMLSLAAFLIVGGRLADILGRKTWLIIGVSIFGVTSLLGGMGNTGEFVIIMRIFQGVGAAILMPVSMSIVTNAFDPARVQRAVGTVLGIAAIGQASGPLIGGVFTQFLSWRWVLWINVPVSILVLILIVFSVRQSFDESAGKRIDWAGLVLIVVSIGVFTFGVDKAADWGWTDVRTLGCLAAGVVGLLAFVGWERRFRPPLLDLSLFSSREFSTMTLAGAAGNMALVVAIFLSVNLLQTYYGYSPIEAAYLMLALSLGLTVSAQLAGRLERFESRVVMSTTLAVGGVGVIGMGLVANTVWAFLLASVMAGFGMGLAWNFASVVTQSIVPPAKAGAASGAVLTILIGLGGVATAAAASITTTAAASTGSTEHAVQVVLLGFGVLALITAVPVLIWGRAPGAAAKSPTNTGA